MAPIWSALGVLVMVFMACISSLASPTIPSSAISASPALLPNPPLSSPPALSPDITPLFPSPGGAGLSPTESSQPIIPSSPSPPNPDDMGAPEPFMAFPPSGSLPTSSSVTLNVSGSRNSVMVLGLLAFLLIQLFGV